MLSPLLSVIGVIVTLSLSYFLHLFSFIDLPLQFYVPVAILIAYHSLCAFWLASPNYIKRPWKTILTKVAGKYVFWLGILTCVYLVYANHGFYIRFASHTRDLIKIFWWVYIWCGIPYFLFVEIKRASVYDWLNDPFLRVVSLVKLLIKKKWKLVGSRLKTSRYKSLVLMWILRLHFLPVMAEQVYRGTAQAIGYSESSHFDLLNISFLIGLFFLIDSLNATIGYFWESSVTKTRFRAMDTNAFHWIVVLMCYMPFIGYASNFIAFPQASSHLGYIFSSEMMLNIWQGLLVLSLFGIILCTSCLGFSYSNLCYKKIQTRGPYAIVRHPGTFFKIFYFFFTIFIYKAAYTPTIIFAYVFWMGVYITRILCEERFLKQFKEYQDYMKVTRYRLIPGVW